MSELACVSESVYRDALTRGKLYTVLATDGEKRQVRILGDNERIRWFPAYCFDQGDRTVPVLIRYWIEDPITSDYDLPIEVTVLLSDGSKAVLADTLETKNTQWQTGGADSQDGLIFLRLPVLKTNCLFRNHSHPSMKVQTISKKQTLFC